MKYLKSLAIGAAVLVANPAAAAVAVYNLNIVDPSAGLGTGPFGTVTVTENGGALDFVIALSGGARIHDGNANHNAFVFKLNGDPAVTISNLTTGFQALGTTAGNNFDAPPFGNNVWTTAIDCTTACGAGYAGGYAGNLAFKVSAAGALTLASLGFNVYNSNNIYFASDLVIANGSTGNVGATANVTAVPEPATWGLLLMGFGAAGYVQRRRKVRIALA